MCEVFQETLEEVFQLQQFQEVVYVVSSRFDGDFVAFPYCEN